MPDAEPVFRIEFECGNCGDRFQRDYGVGVRVKRRSGAVKVYCPEHGDELGHYTDCDRCGDVECPVCELTGRVTVGTRTPIEGTQEATDAD